MPRRTAVLLLALTAPTFADERPRSRGGRAGR